MNDKFYKVDYFDKPFYFYVLERCCISDGIKSNEVWEPYMHTIFEKYIDKKSIVVECGCHIGTHTVKMASLCDKLYGFEPMPETYEVLNKNIVLNNITNAIIYKKGVADKTGFTKYSWSLDDNPGASGLDNNPMGIPPRIRTTDKIIPVELTTIDSLNLDRLDFMKIDVEGYEQLVIEGAMNTIKKCKPVIIMEVWKDHFGRVDMNYTKNLFKKLLNIGYNVENVHGPDFLFTPIYTSE